MARTPSKMIDLGSTAPSFSLPDTVTGNVLSLEELKGELVTVVMFICNHCPFVKHVNEELVQLAEDFQPEGVAFIAISSNDVDNYPDDSPEKMKEAAAKLGYTFPYLYDATQEVAKSYHAACTPDFFVYNQQLQLAYRGQLDNSRPDNDVPVTGKDIREAINCLLKGKPLPEKQYPSIGCNIKWKPVVR